MNLTRRTQQFFQKNLTIEDALPTRMPVYVNSLAYLFGAGALSALGMLILTGVVMCISGRTGTTPRAPAGSSTPCTSPLEPLMMGMLKLGRAGLLEGALESGPRQPYTLNFTRSLLFFGDDVDSSVARTLDMSGGQWGISHETGPYPGAWWLWPYTFFYQIPPMSTSANGDLQVGAIMIAIFLILLFIPFIPILNRLPRWLPIHRLIWRDWYRRSRNEPPGGNV